jgi:hypothetical protein
MVYIIASGGDEHLHEMRSGGWTPSRPREETPESGAELLLLVAASKGTLNKVPGWSLK